VTGHFLDDRQAMSQLDAHQTLASIEQIGSQIQAVWDSVETLQFTKEYQNVKQVVVAGMGGSILGTHLIQTVFKDQLNVPILIAPDYTVPTFVDQSTLVIGSSYSGNTEETLSAVKDAHQKGALISGITSGGKLSEWLVQNQLPHLKFEAEFNPSQCARMGLGYSIFGQVALFAKLGLIEVTKSDLQAILNQIVDDHLLMSAAIDKETNPAKLLAFTLTNRLPIILCAEHIESPAHIFSNQLNENAKTYAEYRVIPEMNHHLLEGLSHPKSAKDALFVVSLHSDLYHPQNQKRMKLTEELYEKNGVEVLKHKLSGKTKLTQSFETIVFAAYTAFYLSMIYDHDPIPNPNVDWLKSQL